MISEEQYAGMLMTTKSLQKRVAVLEARISAVRHLLAGMPDRVLEGEKKNPAWSKAELWGIERDIVPSVRSMCLSAVFLLDGEETSGVECS